jgi:hypothetical protein
MKAVGPRIQSGQGRGRRLLLAALGAASLAAALSGCGGSGSASSTASSSSSASSSASSSSSAGGASAGATATPVATTSSAPATSGQSAGGSSALTQAGAALAAGQSATVPYQVTLSNGNNGPTYKLRITVQSIERGTLADFNGIQLDADQKASTPYYARVQMTNLSSSALNTSDNDPAGSVQGIDKTGQPQDSVTFLLGTFPRCPDVTTPNPFKAGQSFDTCLTFLVPGGITKVGYTGPPQSYYDSPLTWTAR